MNDKKNNKKENIDNNRKKLHVTCNCINVS